MSVAVAAKLLNNSLSVAVAAKVASNLSPEPEETVVDKRSRLRFVATIACKRAKLSPDSTPPVAADNSRFGASFAINYPSANWPEGNYSAAMVERNSVTIGDKRPRCFPELPASDNSDEILAEDKVASGRRPRTTGTPATADDSAGTESAATGRCNAGALRNKDCCKDYFRWKERLDRSPHL